MVISGWSSQGVFDCRLQELKLLEEDANVYKLVGPVLVKQDLVEAKANVNKRLEFIRGEIERVEQQLAKLQDKQSKRQQQVGGSLSPAACWEQANCCTSTPRRPQQGEAVQMPAAGRHVSLLCSMLGASQQLDKHSKEAAEGRNCSDPSSVLGAQPAAG